NPLGKERGLIFLCYQCSITNQFEYLTRWWLNDQANNRKHSDPVTNSSSKLQFELCLERIVGREVTFRLNVPRFVLPEGGAYLFAPSLLWLESNAAER